MEPEPEQLERDVVLQQVEFYFGDANLPKDKFLKKQIKADPENEGWVPLEVLASFKKMKGLKADAEIIAAALDSSELLEVSDDRTRVRRTRPLPAPDKSAPRTVVVQGLTMEPTIEAVGAAFGRCGEVKLVRIVQPEVQLEGEWASCKHQAFRGREVLAVVEYATQAQACDACEKLDESRNSWRGGMGVSLLQKGAEFKKREASQRQSERDARERRKDDALAQEKPKQKPSGLSALAEGAEGVEPPKERPRLKLAKRGASVAVAKTVTVKKAAGDDGATIQVDVPLLLAKGPDGTRGFAGSWRRDHPWNVDGVEKRIDPSDGVAYRSAPGRVCARACARACVSKHFTPRLTTAVLRTPQLLGLRRCVRDRRRQDSQTCNRALDYCWRTYACSGESRGSTSPTSRASLTMINSSC
jgi:hypothetical protein